MSVRRAALFKGAALFGRAAGVATVVTLAIFAVSGPVGAHGVGGRTDLPLPAWQVAWAAVCVLGISFVAVGRFWRRPRLQSLANGKPLPLTIERLSQMLLVLLKVFGLTAFVVVLYAALRGNINPSVNIAPTALYIVVWVGMPIVSILIGDLWRAVNPMPLLAGVAGHLPLRSPYSDSSTESSRMSQSEGHHWWAAVVLAGFVWLELAYFESSSPRAIGVFLVAYLALMVLGGAVQGRSWAVHADGFGTLFSYFAAMGPFGRNSQGRLSIRWPLCGLASIKVLPGTTALLLVALGSTSFDGFTRSSIWLDVISNRSGWELTLVNTIGLLFVIGVVFVIYRAAIAIMAVITGEAEQELSDLFIGSLVPITVAYIVAHYFSLLILEGQSVLAHISDPFGRGWDIFGTATRQVDFTVISTDAIAWVQTAAIVVGHILAVVVAHDRSVARFKGPMAIRSQYPMLVAMIAYTFIGLMLLIG